MPAYNDDPRALLPWLIRVLSRSFRVGRFFRSEVRMYWVAVILMPLLFLDWFWRVASGLELLVLTAFAVTFLYLIVWTHEMGHALWARRFGIATPLITLSPLGGLAHLGSGPTYAPRRRPLTAGARRGAAACAPAGPEPAGRRGRAGRRRGAPAAGRRGPGGRGPGGRADCWPARGPARGPGRGAGAAAAPAHARTD